MIYQYLTKHPVNKVRGFTLIETFVAITVLMIAVLGPMTLLSRALQDSRYLKDEMAASFLAQEGVELMIADREDNGSLYLSIGDDPGPFSCPQFFWEEETGFNCDNNGTQTTFARTVKIDQEGLPEGQYRITSIASFARGTSRREVTSSSIIFGFQ